MVLFSWSAALLTLAAIARASPTPGVSRTRAALPEAWYQPLDHPAYKLFHHDPVEPHLGRRDPPTPSVGSAAWTAKYPASTPDNSQLPKVWLDALNNTTARNKIPNIPPSTESGSNSPVYPDGTNQIRDTPAVCSATNRACRIPGNIWDAPDGVMGLGFDDGPTTASPQLYAFLKQNNQTATHYMIGLNILHNWQIFLSACQNEDDIAVHTWTHPYMTTLDNISVLAQLAWTMQIIYDTSGGKLPAYWRPPYGDIDARVDAIASEVLGLTAVIWNHDTLDWSIGTPGGTTLNAVQGNMQQWLTGPKSPGLIILEHEISDNNFYVFQAAWPLVQANGWKTLSQLRMNSSMEAYQDGDESDDAFDSLFPDATSTSATTSTTNRTATSTGASRTTKPANYSSSASSMIFSQPPLSALLLFPLLFLQSLL